MTVIKQNPALAANAVMQRLFQMRQLWENAASSYFDPSGFQLALQNCIMTSRTVTFILQSNKVHMNNFDDWYDQHRERWNADPIMRWARDARNSIEKQGDLETHSQVRAIIIASYLDGPESEWLPAALFANPQQLYRAVPKKYLIPHVIENGTLLIERRWIDNELPDMEVLEALAHVYAQFADTLVDYCNMNKLKVPPSLTDARPDAMGTLSMDRALYLSMRDGRITGNRYFRKPMERPGPKVKKFVKKRYGPGANWDRLSHALTLREVAKVYFDHARILLMRDGYHRSFAFLMKGRAVVQMIPSEHPDRASRYVLMRDLAKLARIEGADGVMLISEAWHAKVEDAPSGFAADAINKGEALAMHAADATGDSFSFNAVFHRRRPKGKKIKRIDDTTLDDEGLQFITCPFLREWDVLDPEKLAATVARMDAMGIETPSISVD